MTPLLRSLAVAALAAFAIPMAVPASAMTYELAEIGPGGDCRRDCATVVYASGEIELNSAEELLEFIERSQDDDVRRLLVIDSPGGNVVGSLKLASLFRESKVVVVVGRIVSDGTRSGLVNGGCYSACVYALMGGVRRVVPTGSEVGIHQMAYDGFDLSNDNAITAMLGQRRADADFVDVLRGFAKSMGVNPDLITMAEKVPHSSMRILKPAEIRKLRLARPKL